MRDFMEDNHGKHPPLSSCVSKEERKYILPWWVRQDEQYKPSN